MMVGITIVEPAILKAHQGINEKDVVNNGLLCER
jgi:hypothetical protein